jgi:hypothetical protein
VKTWSKCKVLRDNVQYLHIFLARCLQKIVGAVSKRADRSFVQERQGGFDPTYIGNSDSTHGIDVGGELKNGHSSSGSNSRHQRRSRSDKLR